MCHVGILAHPTVHRWWRSVIRAYWNCRTMTVGQPCRLKCEMFFSLVFISKRKKLCDSMEYQFILSWLFWHGVQRGNCWWSSQSRNWLLCCFWLFFFCENSLKSIREKPWNHRFNQEIEIVIEKIKRCVMMAF